MEMITPMPRSGYQSIGTPSGSVCSGTTRGLTHYEGIQNGRSLIGWRVSQPSPTGNCTIRITDSPSDSKMKSLRPLDDSGNTDTNVFPCGRTETNFEAKEIRLPRDFDCDACILEVQWVTEKGKQSFCADISVSGGLTLECVGVCLNGGICSNGVCNCMETYEGNNC